MHLDNSISFGNMIIMCSVGIIITGIILAAGKSERMGPVNKLLLEYNGQTIIEEVLAQMIKSSVDNIVIVTGYESNLIEETLMGQINETVSIIRNANYNKGRIESIKCALRFLSGKTDAALFMVGDKPGVKSDLISKAINKFRKYNPSILTTQTPSGPGHPIIFSSRIFDEILEFKGANLRDNLIARHKEDVFELNDDALQLDIDTEGDYQKLLESF
ncbi:MAG: nucleotidyltransferase family protein [candidate division Zixibacteria bacterium]